MGTEEEMNERVGILELTTERHPWTDEKRTWQAGRPWPLAKSSAEGRWTGTSNYLKCEVDKW